MVKRSCKSIATKRSEVSSVQFYDSTFLNYPCPKTSGILCNFFIRESVKPLFASRCFATLKVLDVGAGTGWITEEFAKQGAISYALDISPSACNFIRKRGVAKGFEVFIICCDGENLPFKNNAFDVAVIHATLHHFLMPKQALNEVARVVTDLYILDEPCQMSFLNPIVSIIAKLFRNLRFLSAKAGVAYESAMDRDKTRFSTSDLKRCLEMKGFNVVTWKYWGYVPPFFQRTKNRVVVNAYKFFIFMLNRFLRCWGHTFFLRAYMHDASHVVKIESSNVEVGVRCIVGVATFPSESYPNAVPRYNPSEGCE